MKRLSTTLAATALAFGLWAQPRMAVDADNLKLGEIMWQNPKTVSYGFTNKGSDPLVITEVRASCGCVSVSYPKTAIPAGKQGTVTAVYDAGMLGTFYRELAVYTNAQDEPLYLSFEGRVVETAVDYEGDFPIDMPAPVEEEKPAPEPKSEKKPAAKKKAPAKKATAKKPAAKKAK